VPADHAFPLLVRLPSSIISCFISLSPAEEAFSCHPGQTSRPNRPNCSTQAKISLSRELAVLPPPGGGGLPLHRTKLALSTTGVYRMGPPGTGPWLRSRGLVQARTGVACPLNRPHSHRHAQRKRSPARYFRSRRKLAIPTSSSGRFRAGSHWQTSRSDTASTVATESRSKRNACTSVQGPTAHSDGDSSRREQPRGGTGLIVPQQPGRNTGRPAQNLASNPGFAESVPSYVLSPSACTQ